MRAFSIFIIIFLLITNVFLLNYLVAIIDSIYQYMQKGGEFYAKKYRFYYYTYIKQQIDLSYEDLDNFVLHPPPFNVISVIMLLFIPFKDARKRIS